MLWIGVLISSLVLWPASATGRGIDAERQQSSGMMAKEIFTRIAECKSRIDVDNWADLIRSRGDRAALAGLVVSDAFFRRCRWDQQEPTSDEQDEWDQQEPTTDEQHERDQQEPTADEGSGCCRPALELAFKADKSRTIDLLRQRVRNPKQHPTVWDRVLFFDGEDLWPIDLLVEIYDASGPGGNFEFLCEHIARKSWQLAQPRVARLTRDEAELLTSGGQPIDSDLEFIEDCFVKQSNLGAFPEVSRYLVERAKALPNPASSRALAVYLELGVIHVEAEALVIAAAHSWLAGKAMRCASRFDGYLDYRTHHRFSEYKDDCETAPGACFPGDSWAGCGTKLAQQLRSFNSPAAAAAYADVEQALRRMNPHATGRRVASVWHLLLLAGFGVAQVLAWRRIRALQTLCTALSVLDTAMVLGSTIIMVVVLPLAHSLGPRTSGIGSYADAMNGIRAGLKIIATMGMMAVVTLAVLGATGYLGFLLRRNRVFTLVMALALAVVPLVWVFYQVVIPIL
jgi:hypothetical protein